jgi:hypothetical protein
VDSGQCFVVVLLLGLVAAVMGAGLSRLLFYGHDNPTSVTDRVIMVILGAIIVCMGMFILAIGLVALGYVK